MAVYGEVPAYVYCMDCRASMCITHKAQVTEMSYCEFQTVGCSEIGLTERRVGWDGTGQDGMAWDRIRSDKIG